MNDDKVLLCQIIEQLIKDEDLCYLLQKKNKEESLKAEGKRKGSVDSFQ